MVVSLSKGQKVDLTKSNPGLSKISVGLGWDIYICLLLAVQISN